MFGKFEHDWFTNNKHIIASFFNTLYLKITKSVGCNEQNEKPTNRVSSWSLYRDTYDLAEVR